MVAAALLLLLLPLQDSAMQVQDLREGLSSPCNKWQRRRRQARHDHATMTVDFPRVPARARFACAGLFDGGETATSCTSFRFTSFP